MKSQPGVASGGENVDPRNLPEDSVDTNSEPRPAPAPGLPMSEEEFERLKEAANTAGAASKEKRKRIARRSTKRNSL